MQSRPGGNCLRRCASIRNQRWYVAIWPCWRRHSPSARDVTAQAHILGDGFRRIRSVFVAQPVLAVVSVLGKDQKGVVAQFATYLADRGINIEDIEQRVVRGFFVMDMLVDLADVSTDLTSLITGLVELGRSIDMEVRVHLHSERRPKKIAILVSKEPHCLQQLIDDLREG